MRFRLAIPLSALGFCAGLPAQALTVNFTETLSGVSIGSDNVVSILSVADNDVNDGDPTAGRLRYSGVFGGYRLEFLGVVSNGAVGASPAILSSTFIAERVVAPCLPSFDNPCFDQIGGLVVSLLGSPEYDAVAIPEGGIGAMRFQGALVSSGGFAYVEAGEGFFGSVNYTESGNPVSASFADALFADTGPLGAVITTSASITVAVRNELLAFDRTNFAGKVTVGIVPLPPSLAMLGAALLLMVGAGRRRSLRAT